MAQESNIAKDAIIENWSAKRSGAAMRLHGNVAGEEIAVTVSKIGFAPSGALIATAIGRNYTLATRP